MKFKILPLTAVVIAAFNANLNAAVIQTLVTSATSASNGNALDGNISSTDLINIGQSTYTSVTSSEGTTFGSASSGNDGSAAANANIIYDNSVSAAPVTFTYTLNTSVNTLGYDIESIRSFYGWATSGTVFADQLYTVSYATVGAPSTYTTIATVSYDPATQVSASQITITEDAGSLILASGVSSIRFALATNPGNSQVGIAREFDVFGTATAIPEPSAALLGGIGILALLRRRR